MHQSLSSGRGPAGSAGKPQVIGLRTLGKARNASAGRVKTGLNSALFERVWRSEMIKGKNILLRPIEDEDWTIIKQWGKDRNLLWGPYQRFQLDHVPLLRQAYQQMGLLSRESGFLLVETIQNQEIVGYVRYAQIAYPDADSPYPEIGFGIPQKSKQGKGYAKETVGLLVSYLFAGYPVERVIAFTEQENLPAQHVMESIGFQQEGILRRSIFRDGQWRDIVIFGLLREEVIFEI
jgi:RimJ/RimL family protein N-acetyltransferase